MQPLTPEEDAAQFAEWIHAELAASPLHTQGFGPLMARAERVVLDIRKRLLARGERATWKRLMKKGRLTKELNETLPAIARVVAWVEGPNGAAAIAAAQAQNGGEGKLTIIDLCSGVGYMSILLAELLAQSPSARVRRIVLVDHAFPQWGAQPKPSNINPGHLYLDGMWPIELTHRRYNLKKTSGLRQMNDHVIARAEGAVLVLAVHLCGTLALRAVQFFNDHPKVAFFCLKPCCLPPLILAKQKYVWKFPNRDGVERRIVAKDVCASGSYNKGTWRGSAPKHHQKVKFEAWARGLFASVDVGAPSDGGAKDIEDRVLLPGPIRGDARGAPDAEEGTGGSASSGGAGSAAAERAGQPDVLHFQTLFLFARRPYCNAAGAIRGIGGNPYATEGDGSPSREAMGLPKRPASEAAGAGGAVREGGSTGAAAPQKRARAAESAAPVHAV
jgi:hypothetical protein